MTNAVEMKGISKQFGKKVLANDNVNLEIKHGEILSLLGENGSGKTTLMNVLSGIYYPDSGEIFINGEKADISSPADAYNYKIGMVHQHFKLVDVFNVVENIALGCNNEKYNLKNATEKIVEICDKYGFIIDPKKKIYDMSVSEKQTVEIIKVLYRGADILILDEPTAVLTPQETEHLFDIIRNMKKDGKSIVIITHKLNEVLEISDRIAVLRKGKNAGSLLTEDADESKLAEMMVGEKIELNIERNEPLNVRKILDIKHLTVKNEDNIDALSDVSFTVNTGEILGIAGISGCGQKQLLESIAGLSHCEEGSSIEFFDTENGKSVQLIGKNPRKISEMGIALSFVPEDRLGMGLVGSMNLTENMMLKTYRKNSKMGFVERKSPKALAMDVKEKLDVATPDLKTEVSKLSGGNVQKILVGREIAFAPKVLMTAYAVRGLDINTSYTIYDLLNKQKQNNSAVIYVGEDLDVLLELCDRVLVLCSGKVNGILDARKTTKEEVGYLMTDSKAGEDEAV